MCKIVPRFGADLEHLKHSLKATVNSPLEIVQAASLILKKFDFFVVFFFWDLDPMGLVSYFFVSIAPANFIFRSKRTSRYSTFARVTKRGHQKCTNRTLAPPGHTAP